MDEHSKIINNPSQDNESYLKNLIYNFLKEHEEKNIDSIDQLNGLIIQFKNQVHRLIFDYISLLPSEILLLISIYLEATDIKSMILTCNKFKDLFLSQDFSKDFMLRWELEHYDSHINYEKFSNILKISTNYGFDWWFLFRSLMNTNCINGYGYSQTCDFVGGVISKINYFGHFKDSRKTGKGMFIMPDKKFYFGQLKNDYLDGFGCFYWPLNERYIGEYSKGLRHGKGSYYYHTNARHFGNYVLGKANGYGEYIDQNGPHFEGNYCDDKRDGQGTYTWTNGTKYVGEFSNDILKGKGTFHFIDGNQFSDEFSDDLPKDPKKQTHPGVKKCLKNGECFSMAKGNKYSLWGKLFIQKKDKNERYYCCVNCSKNCQPKTTKWLSKWVAGTAYCMCPYKNEHCVYRKKIDLTIDVPKIYNK